MATAGELVGTDFAPAANVAQSSRGDAEVSQETRVDFDRVSGIIALGASAVCLAISAGNFLSHRPDAGAVWLGIAAAAAIYGASSLFGVRWSRSPDRTNQN